MNLPSTSALLGSSGIEEIKLSDIRADEQIRTSISDGFSPDSLRSLADSIERIGVQEPIIVRPEPEKDKYQEKYRIVCGERRFRAAKMTSRQTIPAIVRNDLTDPKEIMFLQITENAQREGIDAMELAHGVEKLFEMGMNKTQIATAIGKPNDYVSYLFAMLKMPDFLKREYDNGHLSHSPRACYEYVNLYNRDPERCEQCILQLMAAKSDDDDLTGFLDRSLVKKIKSFIDEPGMAGEAQDAAPDGAGSEEEGGEEAVSGSGDDGSADYDPAEYPEHEERGRSAEVEMAPAQQGDGSHTAGIGNPDFTDRDTRGGGDLSDGIESAEEREDDVQTGEPELTAWDDEASGADEEEGSGSGEGEKYPERRISKFYVTWNGVEYRLSDMWGDAEGEVILIDEYSGRGVSAPFDEVTLARGS